jgi:hypothetical protein
MKPKTHSILIALSILSAEAVLAQDAKDPSQLKSLMQLKGHWESPEATLQSEGKKYTFSYYADFESIANNSGLSMHEWCDIPNMGKRDGANLIGVDPQDGKIHWFTVDNMGTTHEHVGEFSDDQHFSMVNKSMHAGHSYFETVVLELVGREKLKLKVLCTLDGKEVSLITGMFVRKTEKQNN